MALSVKSLLAPLAPSIFVFDGKNYNGRLNKILLSDLIIVTATK